MPTDLHLEYVEITEFNPGLWTAGGSLLMPSQGWQEMVDCRPEPGGGLRAAAEPTTWSLSGISTLIQSRSHVLGIMEVSSSERYLILREDASVSVWNIRVFSWDGSVWTQVGTTIVTSPTGNTEPQRVMMDTFLADDGTDWVLFNLNMVGTDLTVEGLYKFARGGAGAWTKIFTATSQGPPAFAVADDRVLWTDGGRTLYFGNSLSLTLTTSNFIVVNGSAFDAAITGILPIGPSDILVGSNGNAWARIQGDIASNPTPRVLSDSHPLTNSQRIRLSDLGIPFIEQIHGVYVTGDGNSAECISAQIEGNTWSRNTDLRTVGDLGVADHWLYAPHGYVFDARTQSWFTMSAIANGFCVFANRRLGTVSIATTGYSPVVYSYDADEGSRASVFHAKTAPFRGEDGRRVKIRSVQVPCVGYSAGDTVQVTVKGTTKTYTFTAAERQSIPFLFHEEGEMLDVTITSTANAAGEAPTIEALRIGKGWGHRTR